MSNDVTSQVLGGGWLNWMRGKDVPSRQSLRHGAATTSEFLVTRLHNLFTVFEHVRDE
jgi:hypothetical protein